MIMIHEFLKQPHTIGAMEREPISKNRVSPKNDRSRRNQLFLKSEFMREKRNLKSSKMRRTLLILGQTLLVLSLIFTIGCKKDDDDKENGKWVKKANYPGAAVSNAVAFSINGKVYVGMGYASSPQSDLWEYDPATNKWTEKHYFPGDGLSRGMYFVADNQAYIIDLQYILWEYNPATDTWVEKSTCPVSYDARVSFVFGISNKGYIGSNRFHSGLSSSWVSNEALYEYNLATNTWKECAIFPSNSIVEQQAIVSTEQNAYSIGGYTSGDHASSGGNVYMYNPVTDRWTERASFPVKTKGGIAFCKNGIIYAGLGRDYYNSQFASYESWRDEDHNKIYKYDSENNSWSLETEAPIQGEGKIAVICNGKLYVGLGGSLDFWEYAF
jgi:N-acetylneuraminic acid mutarotase